MSLGLKMIDFLLQDGEAEFIKVWGFSWGDSVIKEMIVDYRRKRTEHAPILIDGASVEQVGASSSLVSTSPTN